MDDPGTDFERAHRQLLIARARRLERMQLVTPEGPLRWSLSPDAEDVLRRMGERGDIIKAMHRAMTAAKLERSPQLYTIYDRDAVPIVGRVVARGLSGDDGDRRFLVIDGIDGRSHYADIGEAEGNFPIGSPSLRMPDPSKSCGFLRLARRASTTRPWAFPLRDRRRAHLCPASITASWMPRRRLANSCRTHLTVLSLALETCPGMSIGVLACQRHIPAKYTGPSPAVAFGAQRSTFE
ncbi:MAG: DUF3363 domain-containing protein [Xanthobacteraceae bacterium]